MKSTVQTVLDNLRNHGAVSDTAEKVYAATDRTKRAGVLIALVLDKETDQVHVILTKRSLQLRTHAGEVALPGGRMDEQDADIAATALREAHEEIGLHPDHVDILSYHDPAISLHKLVVTPVCGIIKDSLLSSSAAPSKASATVSTLASSISKDEDSTSLSIHTSTPSTPHNASNSVQILQSLTSNPTEVSSLFTTQLSTFLSTSGHTAQRFDLDGRVWRGHAFEVASGGQEYTQPKFSRILSRLIPSPVEVDSVFAVPLRFFLQATQHTEQRFPTDDGGVWRAHRFVFKISGTVQTFVIFGLTAHILVEFAVVAFGELPEFERIPVSQRPRI
ncbi:hypothetical protein BC830DRAFT_657831 [Chytriomyces sp. MP71]|nr:hypothetical protein BC830DRAFT_657831 [Chytriomyces sp. MP71]